LSTSNEALINLSKNFDDQTLEPFTSFCNFMMYGPSQCVTILPADDTPRGHNNAFSRYGMSGYVCLVGKIGGIPSLGEESSITYTFELPRGMYSYDLSFRYLIYNSGSNKEDIIIAEAKLFNKPIWTKRISSKTVNYGIISKSGTVYWKGGETSLTIRLKIKSLIGYWIYSTGFAVDDINLIITKAKKPTKLALSIYPLQI
jgi:hypothetical protein